MLTVALAVVAPTVIFGAVVWLPRFAVRLLDPWRGRRAALRRAGLPQGPPIERLAAGLRRLHREQDDPRRTRARREGARLAYDDLLVDACHRLEVDQDLAGRAGLSYTAERMRLEAALAAAGLDVRSRRPTP